MEQVAILQNKIDILELIAKFSHYFDSGDIAGWVGLFTEDGMMESRRLNGKDVAMRIEGREQLKVSAKKRIEELGGKKLRHWQTSTLFLELSNNAALARTYIMVLMVDAPKEAPHIIFSGFYEDEIVKQGETWLFSKRTIFADGVLQG